MAVTITLADFQRRVAGAAGENAGDGQAILDAATAIVEREAPGAPDAVQNEAVVRLGGYLSQSDYGGIVKEEIGAKSVEYAVNAAAMFHRSGAKGLLSPWKVRRGGVV